MMRAMLSRAGWSGMSLECRHRRGSHASAETLSRSAAEFLREDAHKPQSKRQRLARSLGSVRCRKAQRSRRM